jgi:hypothetical protein
MAEVAARNLDAFERMVTGNPPCFRPVGFPAMLAIPKTSSRGISENPPGDTEVPSGRKMPHISVQPGAPQEGSRLLSDAFGRFRTQLPLRYGPDF